MLALQSNLLLTVMQRSGAMLKKLFESDIVRTQRFFSVILWAKLTICGAEALKLQIGQILTQSKSDLSGT